MWELGTELGSSGGATVLSMAEPSPQMRTCFGFSWASVLSKAVKGPVCDSIQTLRSQTEHSSLRTVL